MNELAFADPFGVVMAWMVKAMNASLEKAITLHVVNLQRPGNEFAGDLAADVFLDAVGQGRFAQGNASLIVVELDVVHEEGLELVQVALVVGVEKRSVERGANAVQFRLTFNLVERRNVLRVRRQGKRNQQTQSRQNDGNTATLGHRHLAFAEGSVALTEIREPRRKGSLALHLRTASGGCLHPPLSARLTAERDVQDCFA
jgi:hypothetical protein